MCCAMKRADLVPSLFQDAVSRNNQTSSVMDQFYSVREVLVIIWPFVGLPQVIPACLGLAGFLQSKGITHVEESRNR